MERKDSSEYGWTYMSRQEYERMHEHEYAGPGTPLDPAAPGYWAMANEDGATVLYTGLSLAETWDENYAPAHNRMGQ